MPFPGAWKDPLDVRHVEFVRNRCPAVAAVAEPVEPDHRRRVHALGGDYDLRVCVCVCLCKHI